MRQKWECTACGSRMETGINGRPPGKSFCRKRPEPNKPAGNFKSHIWIKI